MTGMDNHAAYDALRALENSARLLRLALSDNDVRPTVHKWGDKDHVDEIVARLGVFEARHLAHELQLRDTAVQSRIKAAIKRGTIIEIEAHRATHAAVYRWTGKIA
jgi:hypothetical protein